MRNKSVAVLPKRTLTVDEYSHVYGPGRTTAYKLMNSGKLQSVVVGGRRLILVDSAEALLRPDGSRPNLETKVA